MTESPETFDAPEIVTDGATYTLGEICLACNVTTEWIVDLVEYGAVDLLGSASPDWRFEGLTVVRVARAKRLQRDLGLNAPGIALAFDLLDEIAMLRARLKAVERPASVPGDNHGA